MDKNPLLGTWRLKSYVVTKATGERLTPYGERPTGYLTYAPDGYMQVIGVAAGRGGLGGTNPPDKERVSLYDTMFAYSGTFSVRGDNVVHHVDVSWNEAWTGTDQIRAFEVSGNILTLATRFTDAVSGSDNSYVVAWEKVLG